MPAEISNVKTSQVSPFPAAGAATDVVISFDIVGIPPDVVEIYTGEPGNPLQTRRKSVDITPPDVTGLTATLSLVAGMVYALALCPRTATNGNLNDRVDGEYWERFCLVTQLTTHASTSPGQGPVPVFTRADPRPRTLTRPNRIELEWRSDKAYNRYNLQRRYEGYQLEQVEVHGTKYTEQPTKPGAYYTFSLEGQTQTYSENVSSPWTAPRQVRAAPKTHSLREFTEGSDIRSGIRRLLANNSAKLISLRALMEL